MVFYLNKLSVTFLENVNDALCHEMVFLILIYEVITTTKILSEIDLFVDK